jgi:O-succinylbenzoate synthase
VNALLRGSEQEMLAQAHRALEGGCECLKIKTEKISLGRLPAFLRAVLRGAPTRCRLRLDPNRSWGFQETLSVAESLADLPISYIEEPLREVGRLPELIAKCPLPIALDETLRSISPQDMEPYRGAAALVLKPTLLGGFTACRAFAEAGLALGMLPVVSACYESGVGIDALGRFAASLPVVAPAGLDTYSSLVSDVLCERLDLRDFVFRADTPRPNVDRSRLLPL